MKFKFLKAALTGLIVSVSSFANAGLIKYEFSGVFTRSVAVASSAIVEANLGDDFDGEFTYDDEQPLLSIISPGTRARYNTGEILASTGIFNYSASIGPQLQIYNNWEFTPGGTVIDDFFLSVYQYDKSGTGYYLIQLIMRDYTTNTLNDLSIPNPMEMEQLSKGGHFFLRRFTSSNNEEWWADGSMSNIRAVTAPEPTTLAIFALGMIGLVSRRFKKL